jgi:hypothetical protein
MVDTITMMDFYFVMSGVLFIYFHERYYNYETMIVAHANLDPAPSSKVGLSLA